MIGNPICTHLRSLSRWQNHNQHNCNHNRHSCSCSHNPNHNRHVRTKQHSPNSQHKPTQSSYKRPRRTTQTTQTTNHRPQAKQKRRTQTTTTHHFSIPTAVLIATRLRCSSTKARNKLKQYGNRKEVCYPVLFGDTAASHIRRVMVMESVVTTFS